MFYIYTSNYYGKYDVELEISSYDDGLGLDFLLINMDFNSWIDNNKKERGSIHNNYCANLYYLPGTVHTRDGDNF